MKRLLVLLIASLSLSAYSEKKPNILLILTDDQGIGDLGCYGNKIIKTPNIDKFSRESLNLMDFHVERSCAPTRTSLMTGRQCNRTGLWYTITQRALPHKDESNIALELKKGGYTTGMFGKWHMGDSKPYSPEYKGFDRIVRHGGGGVGQTGDYWGNDYFDDTYLVDGKYQAFEGYCTDVFTAEAIKFMEKAVTEGKPFFCYLATNAPHGPYLVADSYKKMYAKAFKNNKERTAFYGMITNLDENFKKLEDSINALGIRDNTIVIYMTDNGTGAGVNADKKTQFIKDGFNLGMRGKKASMYDGGHRVPFIIRYPDGGLDSHREINTLTAHVDVLPTLLEYAGVEYTGKKALDGKSMVNLINNGDETGFAGRILVTDSHIKRIPPKWIRSAVMQDKYRLVAGEELYDVSKDPSQKNDISKSMPEKVAELRSFYDNWYDSIHSGDNLIPNPLYVYNDQENEINSHYMQPFNDAYPAWNQDAIKKGNQNTGTWEIEVVESGEYTLDLRRYPIEFDKAITWGDKKNKALKIETAELIIDGKNLGTKQVNAGDKYVRYTLQLEKGRHVIGGTFKGNKVNLTPYFIYINSVK